MCNEYSLYLFVAQVLKICAFFIKKTEDIYEEIKHRSSRRNRNGRQYVP